MLLETLEVRLDLEYIRGLIEAEFFQRLSHPSRFSKSGMGAVC